MMDNAHEDRYIWFNGDIVPVAAAKVSVLSPMAAYGINVFEGIRGYVDETRRQLHVFRLDDHLRRLRASLAMMRIGQPYGEERIREALREVVHANGYREDIALRLTVYVDGHGNFASRGPAGMFIAPIRRERTSLAAIGGVDCCVSSWERISDGNISPRIKTGANYVNSRMAQLEALENGYDSAIFLNRLGYVCEGVGACLFIVRDGCLITPPLTASLLEGITRATLLTLAADLGIAVCERELVRTELYVCDEAFLCGTAVEVTPILSVDRHLVGDGAAGPLTKQLLAAYLRAAGGEEAACRHWLTPMY